MSNKKANNFNLISSEKAWMMKRKIKCTVINRVRTVEEVNMISLSNYKIEDSKIKMTNR